MAYDGSPFRRSGRSEIALPPVSVGLWQNFGDAFCPHSSFSISSRKGQDDDLANFHRHK